MKSNRLEAFTDGVIAIVLTIMVLEMKVPGEGAVMGLIRLTPFLLAYGVSFATIAVFWVNHHRLLQARHDIDSRTLWSNLFLLFWLTLIPFTVRWLTESHFGTAATATFGIVLGLAAVGYHLTERAVVACNPTAPRAGFRGRLSIFLYAIAVPLSLVSRPIAVAIYVAVIGIWLLPDRTFWGAAEAR